MPKNKNPGLKVRSVFFQNPVEKMNILNLENIVERTIFLGNWIAVFQGFQVDGN